MPRDYAFARANFIIRGEMSIPYTFYTRGASSGPGRQVNPDEPLAASMT
jgi:hypothetical protein